MWLLKQLDGAVVKKTPKRPYSKNWRSCRKQARNNHIISLFGACPGPVDHTVWIVTEPFLTDLHNLIHDLSTVNKQYSKRLPELNLANCIWLLIGVALGIEGLHSLRIVHGDINPANIVVAVHGSYTVYLTPKLSNMVFSKHLLENTPQAEPSKDPHGTANYTAPELVVPLSWSLPGGINCGRYIFVWPRDRSLIERCWSQEPSQRPHICEVIDELCKIRFEAIVPCPAARVSWIRHFKPFEKWNDDGTHESRWKKFVMAQTSGRDNGNFRDKYKRVFLKDFSGHIGIAKELVQSGCSGGSNMTTCWGGGANGSLLWEACEGGCLEAVKWVMSTFRVGSEGWELVEPFYSAVRQGNVEVVRWLGSSTNVVAACRLAAKNRNMEPE
ncbi:hypothetical protein Pelo_13620 [Pelomyxa schiedti]|nr:hypothetical protein Pelo_13620 [Pelomyxa schiedti]